MSARYFLDQDGDGHWYLVPVGRKADWETWLSIPEGDPAGWDTPVGVERIGGSPTLVIFTNPAVG